MAGIQPAPAFAPGSPEGASAGKPARTCSHPFPPVRTRIDAMPAVSTPDASQLSHARMALDQWVRELMQWHFNPDDRAARSGSTGPRAPAGIRARRSTATTTSTSSGSSRTSGCAAAPVRRWVPKGYAGQARLRLRDRRQHGRPEVAHQHRRLPHRLRDVQRDAAGRALPEGRRLARWSARAARGGCGWPSSTWRSTAAASASWSISIRAG